MMKHNSLLPGSRVRTTVLLLVILLTLTSSLSACSAKPAASSADSPDMAAMSGMPDSVKSAPTVVSDAYRFAVAHPDAVKNVPCYCGCGASGHTSNYSCYVQEVKDDGQIVFDSHALGCTICVDITQDVMRLTKAGKSPGEIRAAIDATYS
ncbi:MAG TPA: PCYCGC motif-containing (lipo)protein [Anaerolineaceae bacterium]|jgi:fatty acid-binding protein DegV